MQLVTLAESGLGIAEEEILRLFEPFVDRAAGADAVLLNTGFSGRQLGEVSRREGVTVLLHDADFEREVADADLDGITTLVHGDYRIDNLIYARDRPQVLAVLDWELSTLGHPYSDLAYQCMQWRMPPGEDTRGFGGVDRPSLGIPTEEDYVARYCQRRGLSGIPIFDFCLAFSFFRMGYASALAWILLAIVAVFTGLSFFTSKYWVHYDD